MIAARGGENPDAVFHPAGVDEGVLGACAIYGANASGKSNTLKALQFMGRAVRDSQRVWGPTEGAPLDPFVLKLQAPTRFEID